MATPPASPLPTFTDGDSGATLLSELNELGYAVQFWTDCDIRPTWHFYRTSTQSIPATTWTKVNFGSVVFDSDSVNSNYAAKINTTGIYAVEACLPVVGVTSNLGWLACFLMTAGTNNPNETSGTTQQFGLRGGYMPTSGGDGSVCISGLTDWVMYPGDVISVEVYASAAATLNANKNTSYENGRFVCNFTGQLVAIP